MKNRADRIAKAKRHLDAVTPAYKAAQKVFENAERALNKAEGSFDVGERVHVEETCRRGCCVEFEGDGTIAGEETNGTWSVKLSSGSLHRHVYSGDIKRLP